MNPETARLFNSTITAAAVAAATELRLFDALERDGCLDYEAYCDRNGLHLESIRAILDALATFDIVRWQDAGSRVEPGPLFADVAREKSFFHWLIGGYGPLLRNLPRLARLATRPNGAGEPSASWRDPAAIASAAEEYGERFVDPQFSGVLAAVPYSMVLDLGCGSGGRLISLLREHPSAGGIGVDVNPDAVRLARAEVRKARLEDRIAIVQGDAGALCDRAEYREVDLIMSFFMGHDLWPRDRCLRVLSELARVCPRATRFLLCDTCRSDAPRTPGAPTFTLGFEFTHAVMGQYVPAPSEWLDLFAESPWRCVAQHEIGIPNSYVFDLRRTGPPG